MADLGNIRRFSLILNSLMIACCATLVGIYAVKGGILPVFFGYILFVVGYKIGWYGTHRTEQVRNFGEHLHPGKILSHVKSCWWNYTVALMGVGMTSYGTVLFADIILKTSTSSPLVAGFFTFGGYMVVHEGVNEVLV